ncbi:hypothetical protein RyT2_14060 [Pseudolactococcus yaeyamensis]
MIVLLKFLFLLIIGPFILARDINLFRFLTEVEGKTKAEVKQEKERFYTVKIGQFMVNYFKILRLKDGKMFSLNGVFEQLVKRHIDVLNSLLLCLIISFLVDLSGVTSFIYKLLPQFILDYLNSLTINSSDVSNLLKSLLFLCFVLYLMTVCLYFFDKLLEHFENDSTLVKNMLVRLVGFLVYSAIITNFVLVITFLYQSIILNVTAMNMLENLSKSLTTFESLALLFNAALWLINVGFFFEMWSTRHQIK